ncbi:MAG TPA: TonB family protein [Thermoanaerobaculia bacterium]|jgi:TonB family protein|nr:TonB family protein [Thermoanaerobaculia bacterium]
MAPLSGSLAEKYEILERLRRGGMGAVSPGNRIPDAEELDRALAEVQARFPGSAAELGSFFDPLLSAAGEAEPPDDLYLHAPASPAATPSRMDEVTWAKPSPGPLHEPLQPPPASEPGGDSSSLLFRLALSTAALLVLFVFARGFWWPEPEGRESAPAWAAPRTIPPPPAAAEPPSRGTAAEEPKAEPTLAEELAGEPAEPAAPSAPSPKPLIVEAAPAPVRPAPPAAQPEPAASRPQPLPKGDGVTALARRLPPPWEEGPQPANLLKPGPGVEEPVPLDLPRFAYPDAARGTGLKADVRLALLVDEKGRVIDARVRDGAPPDLGFSETALAAAKRIPFQPATRYDVPGKMWTEVILEFVE